MAPSTPLLSVQWPPTATAEAVFALNDVAHTYYAQALRTPGARAARAHLLTERGLPGWMITEAKFGYLPSGNQHMVRWLHQQGQSLLHGVDAGLLKPNPRWATQAFTSAHHRAPASAEELTAFFVATAEGRVEAFNDYPIVRVETTEARTTYGYGDFVTMPIQVPDATGALRIGGFQFRNMRPAAVDRYRSPLNSPAMQWARVLIGLAEDLEVLAASRHVVLCEGRFDQLAVRAAVRDLPLAVRPAVVALGGISVRGELVPGATAPEQRAGVLAQLQAAGAERVTLLLDTDARGTDAVCVVGPRLAALGLAVDVARLADAAPPGVPVVPKDASKLFATEGAMALQSAVAAAGARPLGLFLEQWMAERLAATPTSGQVWTRLQALDDLVAVLADLPPAMQAQWGPRLARQLSLPPDVVPLAIADGQGQGGRRLAPARTTPPPGRPARVRA